MAYAYAVNNILTGLAATAFTPGAGPSDATRARFNDGQMGSQYLFTSASGSNTLVIDLGSARNLQGFAVLNSNLHSAVAPTLKVEGADDAAITVNPVTAKAQTTLTQTRPKHRDHVLQFAAVSRRYWRLTWTWTGSFALKVGEVFAYGPYLAEPVQLTRIANDGSSESEEYFQGVTESDTGEVRAAVLGGPVRTKQLLFSDFNAAEETGLRTMFYATVGQAQPLLWIDSYEATATAAATAEQECLYGFARWREFRWSWVDHLLKQVPTLELRSMGREVGA